MSKRFGRNQRRKMRQIVADLERAASLANRSAEAERRSVHELESRITDWAREVQRLALSDTAYAREFASRAVQDIYGPIFQFAPPERLAALMNEGPIDYQTASRVLDLTLFLVDVHRDKIRPGYIFEIQSRKTGRHVLAMDEQAMDCGLTDQRTIYWIAEQLAGGLARAQRN